MKFDIDEVINRATKTALELIAKTDLTSLKELEESNASVPVGDDWHIFMDFGYRPDLTKIWLWFSLEDNTQDGWQNSLDEQDTTDLSEDSIRLNLRYLLKDWQFEE